MEVILNNTGINGRLSPYQAALIIIGALLMPVI